MTTEDDEFLTAYNKGKLSSTRLSDDDFERVMEVFERTAAYQTPYGAIDNTILPYDAMVGGLRELEDDKIMPHAIEMYEYWKGKRQDNKNKALHPALKFETHQETDDMDPYVCFRRREVRQTRKTRNRDVQSGDKLKRLRRELEEARQLLLQVRDLETKKQELLVLDRLVFDKRASIKQIKVKHRIPGGDEDLINQRPQKRKAAEPPPARPPPPTQLRIPVRPETRPQESDLLSLSDKLAENENELRNDIMTKVQNHQTWNKGYIDLTKGPLSPIGIIFAEGGYRPAKTQYLLTPPASDAESGEVDPMSHEWRDDAMHYGMVHSHNGQRLPSPQPEFRLRIGRNKRLWIDRRGVPGERRVAMENSDRWKYDSDSEDDIDMIEVDPYETRAMKFRATIPLSISFQSQRRVVQAQGALPPANGQNLVSHQQASSAQGANSSQGGL